MNLLDDIRTQRQNWRRDKAPAKPPAERPDFSPRAVTGWGGTEAAEIADGYVEYAQVYRTYTWVRKAIDVTSRNIVGLPVRVVDGDDKPQEKHPLTLLLGRGNDTMAMSTIWAHWVTSMYLGGEGPLEIIDDQRGNPLWLWPRRPDLVLVRPDMSPERQNYPAAAGYMVLPEQGQGTPMDVPAQNMVFSRFVNPLNGWRGLAPVTALRASVVIDLFAMAWAKTFLQRGARPDYALVAPQGITRSERERLEAELMFKFGGAANWHKPIVLEDGVTDIKTFSFAPADMEWVEQRQFTRDEIGALFGVPDEIMGYGKDTYENFQTALEVFWTLTLKPLIAHRDDSLNHFFTAVRPLLEPGLRIATDLSSVGVLQEDKLPKVEMAAKLWTMGAPFNQLDAALQLGIGPVPNGDQPFGTDPVEKQRMAELAALGQQAQAGDGAQGDAPPQDQGRGQDGEDQPDGSANQPDDEEAAPAKRAKALRFAHGTLTPATVKALLLQLDPDDDEAEQRIRMALERRAAKELRDAMREMLDTLYPDGWGGDLANAEREAIRAHNAFLADQRMKDALSRALIDGVDLGVSVGVGQLESVGFGFDWTLAHVAARDWAIAHTDDVLAQLAGVTQRGVGQSIGRWLENGESLDTLKQDLMIFFGPERAQRVAATEVTRAAAEGARAAYRESGVVEEYEWATAADERVCPTCNGLHGKRRRLDEPFDRGIDRPPAHVNCRCWVRPVIKE